MITTGGASDSLADNAADASALALKSSSLLRVPTDGCNAFGLDTAVHGVHG